MIVPNPPLWESKECNIIPSHARRTQQQHLVGIPALTIHSPLSAPLSKQPSVEPSWHNGGHHTPYEMARLGYDLCAESPCRMGSAITGLRTSCTATWPQ